MRNIIISFCILFTCLYADEKLDMNCCDKIFYDTYYEQSINIFKDYFKNFDNDLEGTSAWKIAPILESDIILYKTTKEIKYLNRLIENIDFLLAKRDNKVNRVNFKQEISSTWSSGSLYHFTYEDFYNKNGVPVIRVYLYGNDLWDPLREGNNTSYITISDGTNPDTFKIKVENPKRKYLNTNKYFNENYDNLTFLNKETILVDDGNVKIISLNEEFSSGKDNPKNINKRLIKNQFQAYVVHTGLYTKPIIEVVDIIKNSKLDKKYKKKAEYYLEAVIKAIEYHDKDWVETGDGTGYYKINDDFINYPRDVILPYNQMFGLLETIIILYKVTGKEKYKNKVKKVANLFKKNLIFDKEKELYIWKYWEWDGYKKIESHTYAKLDIEFINKCYDFGFVFLENDMRYFANTWAKNFIKPNNKFAAYVDGTGFRENKYYLAYAIELAKWQPIIYYKTKEYLEEYKNKVENGDVGYLKSIAKFIKYESENIK